MSVYIPNFFIVGAPKCGTTWLFYYLKQHPEIFMPELKEPGFFSSDLHPLGSEMDENKYFSLFNVKKKRIGEASTLYLYSAVASGKIKRYSPDAKIIIMLRNPVEMIPSLHSQRVYGGLEKITDLKMALDAEHIRKKKLETGEESPSIRRLFYREMARYTPQIQRYLDIFGRENIHVILLDEIKRDPAEVYRKTLQFLEVDCRFQPQQKFSIINPNKGVRNKALHHIFIYLRSNILIQKLKSWFPLALRLKLYKIRINTYYQTRKPIEPDVQKQLELEFREEIRPLGKLIGKDLSNWIGD